MNRAVSILTAILLLVILVSTLLYMQIASAQLQQIYVRWVSFIGLTYGHDYAYSLCYGDGRLFVVGSYYNATGGGRNGIILALDPETGAILRYIYWTTLTSNEIYDCEVLGGYLMGVGWDSSGGGRWFIPVASTDLSTGTGYFWNSHPTGVDFGLAIASNGTDLLAVGVGTRVAGDLNWTIVRTRPGFPPPVWLFLFYNPSLNPDYPYSVGFHSATSRWWIVGNVSNQWHINLRRASDLGSDRAFNVTAGPTAWSIVFDEEGYAYVIGYNSLRKYSSDGSLVRANDAESGVVVTYIDNTVIGISNIIFENTVKPMVSLYNKDLGWVMAYVLNHTYPLHIVASPGGKAVVVGKNIYFAGWYLHPDGDYDWVVYCLNIETGDLPFPIPEPLYITVGIVLSSLVIGAIITRKIMD